MDSLSYRRRITRLAIVDDCTKESVDKFLDECLNEHWFQSLIGVGHATYRIALCKRIFKLKKTFGIVLVSLFISSCGTDESTVDKVSLSKLQSLDTGILYSFELAGVDLNGKNYTGTIEVSNESEEVSAGILVIYKTVTLNIINNDIPSIFSPCTNSTLQIISHNALDMDGNLIRVLENSGDVCTNTSPDKLPMFVEIGDTGALSPLECLANITLYRSWRVEETEQNNLKVIIKYTGKDVYNSVISETEKIYVLDTTGNVIGFEEELTISAHPQLSPYTSRLYLHSNI